MIGDDEAGSGRAPTAEQSDATLAQGDEVARSLGTDPSHGLTTVDAAERLERFGPNRLDDAAAESTWRKLLRQFADPLVYLLIGAVIVSIVAWALEGADGVPIEAVVIALIVAANGVLGYLQESRAEEAVAALQRMAAATAGVLRDGEQVRVGADEVVPGDVLVLGEGDAVVADARLLHTASLTVAESSLTGESEPVLKDTAPLPAPAALGDRTDMVFNGTIVTRGRGRAVVTATGMATEMGHIATLLEQTEEEATPLQREVALVGRVLGLAVVVIAAIVVAAVLVTSDIEEASDLVDVLLLGVSLAVAAVPEGLPAILSMVLALGVQRMARQRAIVKRLSSVETLGSASVICSDKTGTLTRNEMTIERVVTRSGEAAVTGTGYSPEGAVVVDGQPLRDGPQFDEVRYVLGGGSLANDAVLHREEVGDDGGWTIQGDPTDAAFLVAEIKAGIAEERQERFTRVGEVPFTSERKLMTSIESDRSQDGRAAVVTKGAPDILLGRCTHERVGAEVVELTEQRRSEILAEVERLADLAMRTLAVAYRPLPEGPVPEADEALEHDLVYAGMVGIIDPPRREAAISIAEAHQAGLRIVMITGDHPHTAARIATDLGILATDAEAVSGTDLDRLDDESLRRTVREANVYARVAPEHKLLIVDALQADGEIVAMTGDGVNDAPALKSADIGVAMGVTGTDVTKEAANMILADDNFATIVAAVREGRAIFANIQKFLRYLLSSNIGEVLTMFFGVILASVIGLDVGETVVAPLLATQILWINLLTDSAPALAMGVDPPPPNVMDRPPRRLSDRVIDREMQLGVLFVGAVMAVATLLTVDLKLPGGLFDGTSDLEYARTAGFTVLVLAQLFNCFNARSERTSAFDHLFTNPLLWAAIGVSLLLQVLVVHLPFLNDAFETAPLSFGDWMLCLTMASSVLWLDEVRKLVARLARHRR
ncbi:MAG: cation-translocating P-type ATPase [Acidimicrobiales bacterium]